MSGKDLVSELFEHILANDKILMILVVGAISIVAMCLYQDESISEKIVDICVSGVLGSAVGYAYGYAKGKNGNGNGGNPPAPAPPAEPAAPVAKTP